MSEQYIKADLHLHSIYSERPSEWILKTVGTRESYSQPEELYRSAMERGMDLFTLTDHNRIEGVMKLKEKYPARVFSGVEVTSYFPKDGCKIHMLVYGFDEQQFARIDELRHDIFRLREYLHAEELCHSVAHATYAVNRIITIEHIEKLMLMFDVFETLNGGLNERQNKLWHDVLKNLGPETMHRLSKKHRLKSWSAIPWIKGFTAGSDDHSGLFQGSAWTGAPADNIESYLFSIKNKYGKIEGRHNKFHSLAFSYYKIGYQCALERGIKLPKTLLNNLNDVIFKSKSLNLANKIAIRKLSSELKKACDDNEKNLIGKIITTLQNKYIKLDSKLETAYNLLSLLSDQFFKSVILSIQNSEMNLVNIVRKISSSLFGLVVVLPFFTTMKHMNGQRDLLNSLERNFLKENLRKDKKIVWFSDTLTYLNGVSYTIQKIAWLSHKRGRPLTVVSSLTENEKADTLPPNVVLLPYFHSFTPSVYEHYTIKIPSILTSLKMINELNPDEIIISTPGPIGILGLICAKLLSIKTKMIFHTDFTSELEDLMNDNSVSEIVDTFLKTLYNLNDEILVPTNEYLRILEEKGFAVEKLRFFRRGLDLGQFHPRENARALLKAKFNIPEDAITMLYTGRISEDKNLGLLPDIFKKLTKKYPGLYLLVTGDGPSLDTYRHTCRHLKKIRFSGFQSQEILPEIYSGADFFVFPSLTDTFGMSVLEAQACGLPAVVSDCGGPQEIIRNGETGFIAEGKNTDSWLTHITTLVEMKLHKPDEFSKISKAAIQRVRDNYNWDTLLDQFFSKAERPEGVHGKQKNKNIFHENRHHKSA
ncbi:MAG: glycosyltransferase [Spirochaetales bacterium]|nr:glycosyltransferase [Spirochaetales bacterium]